MTKFSALGYYGGKSFLSRNGTGQWIAALLPQELDHTYVEPFAGMLGILLQRREARHEIVNDLNDRLINWWRVVRDLPQEFEHLVRHTPHSRSEFERSLQHLDDGSDLERAIAFHTVIQQGILSGDNKASFALRRSSGIRTVWDAGRVHTLAARLRNVQIECRDAVQVLEDMAETKHSTIYIDPPYAGSCTTPYRMGLESIDLERLGEAMCRQQGKVAISGYGGYLGLSRLVSP